MTEAPVLMEEPEAPESPAITGPMLREIRGILGMSAQAFGDAIGVYSGTLIRWELEQQPMNNPRLVRLAVLGLLAEPIVSRAKWTPYIRSAAKVVAAEEDAQEALKVAHRELERLETAVHALGLARARLIADGAVSAAMADNQAAREFLGVNWG